MAEHVRRVFDSGNAVLTLDVDNPSERTTWPDPSTQFADDARQALHYGGDLTQEQRYFLSSVFGAYAQLVGCPSSRSALAKIRKAQKSRVCGERE